MAKKNLSTDEQIAAHFRALADLYSERESQVEDSDEEEADEDEELETPERENVESLAIKELRELAKEYGIEETKKADILAAFEDLYEEEEEDEDEDEDEEEEDVEDEDEEDEEDELDRDDLEDLDLAALRKVAKEQGHTAADYKGMDKDALIDLIMGEDEDEDEDEDEEDEEEDEDDEDVEELDEDALAAMSHKELLALAKELEIKVPKLVQKASKANQKKLVDLILDSGDDE